MIYFLAEVSARKCNHQQLIDIANLLVYINDNLLWLYPTAWATIIVRKIFLN